jgi:hypothetical protein
MISVLRVLMFFVIALSSFVACAPENEKSLEGTLLFQDKPLPGAQVEVYLKAEKDRSVQPFAVATTDDGGRYQVVLPAGRYFVIGKKRENLDDGHSRMLMAESPANPLTVADDILQVASFNLREMGREGLMGADSSTGVAGLVTFHGEPVHRAYVYVYTEAAGGLIGPSYGEALQTGEDGRFDINLPAGRYSLVARKRVDGGRSGVLSPGDLNAHYPQNPIEVKPGEILELGGFALTRVDAETHARRQVEGVFARTDTVLHGQVVDPEGQPVDEVYVFAYLDSRMVGKPVHMSAPTDAQGRFELFLSDGGTYYVGARSSYGGPLEPGEWIGTYDARPDHSVKVAKGANKELGELIVREFW